MDTVLGIGPVSLLLIKFILVTPVRPDRTDGMVPVNELDCTWRDFNLAKLFKEAGKDPVNLLL